MTAPVDNYPFATKDGNVIPLDIVRPKGLIRKTFSPSGHSSISIPVGSSVAILFASESCFVSLGTAVDAIVDGTNYPDVLYIPKGHAIATTVVEGSIHVLGETVAGYLHAQLIEKWAGLALDIQYTKR